MNCQATLPGLKIRSAGWLDGNAWEMVLDLAGMVGLLQVGQGLAEQHLGCPDLGGRHVSFPKGVFIQGIDQLTGLDLCLNFLGVE